MDSRLEQVVPTAARIKWRGAEPGTSTSEELLCLLASAVGTRVRLAHIPPSLGFGLAKLIGPLLRDVVITRDELMPRLLTFNSASTGTTELRNWFKGSADCLGRQYLSVLRRNFQG